MNIHALTHGGLTGPPRVLATVATLALGGLVFPGLASAHLHRVDGVQAAIVRSTLEVTGNGQGQAVTLRLKAGDPNQLQVDVGNDGTADFTFARAEISALAVTMGAGNDLVRIDDMNGAFTDSIPTAISGGAGNDTLIGGSGAETFFGGPGNDTIIGGRGNDTAFLGSGDDKFVWNPGDGSDTIEGQQGNDTMLFNGANVAENVTLTANAGRLDFFRNVGNVTMNTHGVETVDFNALGGADNITVNDLTGTDVRNVNLDLAGTLGGKTGDGAIDNVTVNGTNGDDHILATGNGAGADVTGLTASVSVLHADPNDTLSIDSLAGSDEVLTTGALGMQVFVNGALI
jgi:Ca2+-binding RTX toxin-like protein